MKMNISASVLRPCASIALICSLATNVCAADRPAKFAVAAGQLDTLGIQTAPLQNQGEPVRLSYPAQVVIPPSAEQVISAPVAGLVSQLLVQQNQPVRAGMPLVRMASAELGQMQLQLLQANSRATLARQAARREQALFDEGLIAQRRVQEAQAALQEAEAALRQSKTALRLGGMPAASIDKVASSGSPQDGLLLLATQAGVVTEVNVKPGQRVESTAALLHVAQTGTLWLEIQAPANQAGGWAPGSKLKVQGRDVAAEILSSSAVVAAGSQMVTVRAVVQGKAGQLRPGELVSVEIPLAATTAGWDVPLSALAHDGDQAYLFVRTQDGFEARPGKVLASSGQRVRVQVAAKAGEQIAVSGVVALKGAWLDAKDGKASR